MVMSIHPGKIVKTTTKLSATKNNEFYNMTAFFFLFRDVTVDHFHAMISTIKVKLNIKPISKKREKRNKEKKKKKEEKD